MNNIEELVNKICENNNYDELLLGIVNNEKKSSINKVLEEISKNKKLNEKEKKSYYNKIFDYVIEINENFKNRVKDIYVKGFNEASETILMSLSCTINSNEKKHKYLKNCLNDYIVKRLEQKNELECNEDYKEKLKKIKIETDNQKLKELYLEIKRLENIDSYKVGFYDAMKLLAKEDM